jgi:protease II
MLVTSSSLDIRVPVYQPAKYVASIRELQHKEQGTRTTVSSMQYNNRRFDT